MIMARNEDGTYSQVGFVKDNGGIDTEYIYDKDGDIVFEKGFTRETSGTVPLTINGIGKDLKAWSITGNTVQNGTPTPDTPQEVKAVGDRTANLFDYKKYFESTFTKFSEYFEFAEIQLKPFTTYTFTTSFSESTLPSGIVNTAFIITTSTEEPKTLTGGISSTRIATKTTEADGIIKIYKRIKGKILPKKEDFDSGMHWLMINEGDTALSYEPYGYKIPVVTRGKNLIDVANVTGNTNTLFTDNVNPKLAQVKFDEATQYTISMKFEIDTRLGWRKITFTYTDGTTSVSPWIAVSGMFKYTSTSGKTIAKVEFTNYNYYGDISVEYIQLEAGTEATEYEPYHEPITTPIYLPTPLYSGEVMRSDGTITRSDGTTETFTAPQIPTINGTTVIDVDTAVKPTEMYTKYKSSK